jgi:hypothetical protein
MPTVPAVVTALKVSVDPLPVSVPSVLLVSAHTYAMPPGHVLLQVGVAVKACVPPVPTAGVNGLSDTEFRATVTVITVDAPAVDAPRVALTKMPTVPVLVPALNVTDEPLPVSVPSVLVVRAQRYVMLPGQVLLQVGVAVNS